MVPTPEELDVLPDGPCRAVALRNRMTRGIVATGGPMRHASLGLSAYVQFTSPIRRYTDMLAHYQIKVRSTKSGCAGFHGRVRGCCVGGPVWWPCSTGWILVVDAEPCVNPQLPL